MTSYVVMERATGARPALDGADRDSAIVRDRFTPIGFLLPVIWLAWHRLWLEAGLALAAMLAIGLGGSYAGLGSTAPWLSLLVSLYVGLEGPALRLAALRRRGWREWGVVEADNAADAETRYLAEMLEAPAAAPVPATPTIPAMPSAPALGLFAYPGSR